MPNHELTRALERLRQRREVTRRELAATVQTPASAAGRAGAALTPGARVFDLVSGEEGEIVGRTSENVVISASKR